ncbi:MAG TPA: L,D-transpeptidase/peptidoglycan binding protein [Candidatus Blautia intestinipullorum]|nr:L,D-transpeptidase/peptidoglycan binding protein [Candidatus Blautia intestinipullorum]
MSSKENRENLPADSADETAAIEEKINAAMDRLTEDYPETSPEEENREYADYEDASVPEEEDEEGAYSGEEPDDIEYAEDEPDDMEEEEEPDENEESPPISERSRNKSARPNPVVYVPMDDLDEEMPLSSQKKKKHKGLKITGLLLIMLIVIAGCAYAGVSYYYADRFFEGTWINGINCSGKTAYETEMLLADQIQNYSIEVLARNQEPQTITGSQINYQYLSSGEVLKLLKQQKPYEWIKGFYEKTNYTVSENTSYDKTLLQNQVISLNCAKAENQVEPENAYVAFKDNQFQIVPETEGSKLNIKQAYQILDKAISETQTSVDFNTAPDAYVSAEITQNDPELQSALEACNNYTKASITYTFGDQTVTLDGNTIKDWLQFDEKGQLLLDDASFQQHIADYVAQVAAQYDTVGTEREFHTTSGRVVYVSGSAYGWAIDQSAEVAQLSQEIQSGAQVTRQPAYSQTANSYGVNDLGDTYIEVDLSEQHMYYYQSGSLIFDSDFVSGNMSYSDRQTPSGIYTLYYKKSPDVLRGAQKPDGTYEYEEPVEYWMPFNGGIGFHDAPWRSDFGGDIYLTNGSHGCINLPPENAAVLYSIIQYNVPIVCFY